MWKISEYSEKITPKLGEALREWLDEGVEPPAPETCEICGVIIRPFKTASGTTKSVEEIIEGSVATYGKKACPLCCVKLKKEHGKAVKPANDKSAPISA